MLTHLRIIAIRDRCVREGRQLKVRVEAGLYLAFSRTGVISWTVVRHQGGRYLSRVVGQYPAVRIKEARELRDALAAPAAAPAPASYTFSDAYADWAVRKSLAVKDFGRIEGRIKNHLLPRVGGVQLRDLTAFTVITALKPLERKGMAETISRLCRYVREIAVFAQNTGRAEGLHDLTHIKENYPPARVTHRPACRPDELSGIFYRLESVPRVYGTVWHCFMCSLYTLARPGEISRLQWDWVDFGKLTITFPSEIMKTGREHTVPVSSQLEAELKGLPRVSPYVFPAPRADGPIGRESVRMMLTRSGLGGVLCAHGIRSVGASWMAEQGVPEEVAEACLAHVSASQVRRAYQRSELLERRRPVMQAWCDFVRSAEEEARGRIRG